MSAPRGRGRGGGRGSTVDLPFRQSGPPGDNRGRGRGRGDFGDRGGRGRSDFGDRGGRGRGNFGDRGRGGRGGGGGRGGRGGFDQGPRIYSPEGGVVAPSAEVEKTENAVVTALAAKKREPGFPERPAYGTQGQAVTLFANYLDLKSVGNQLFRYNVNILGNSATKNPPAGRKARQIISLLLEEHFSEHRSHIVTDHRSTLVSSLKILDSEDTPRDYDVRYKDEHDDDYAEEPRVYRVKVQFTGRLSPSDLLSYLTSTNAGAMFESKQEVIQAMNILLGYHAKTNPDVGSVGANKHFALRGPGREKWDLGAGLEVFRGYIVSARAATSRLLVNVQVKYVACYQEGPLAAVIGSFQQTRSRDINELRRFLSKLRVRVTHIQRKNRRGEIIPRFKTIVGPATKADGSGLPNRPKIDRHGAGPRDVQFFLDAPGQPSAQKGGKGKKAAKAGPAPAGNYVSVADFFRQQYNMNVDLRMPVVNVGTRENPSYLPVEACEVVAGQPAKTKLTPNQTRGMLNFAVRPPPQNAQSIATNGTGILGLGAPPSQTLQEFGVQPNPKLITVPGRVLPVPNIYYRDEKSGQKQVRPNFGSWNMRSIRFSTPSKMTSWTYLVVDFEGRRPFFDSPAALAEPLKRFTDKLNEVGVISAPSKPGIRVEVNEMNYEAVVDSAIARLIAGHRPQVILTILPSVDTGLYNCIKQTCDIKHGVRNVNVLGDKFAKCDDQYFANVGLKFNLKLGGNNQVLRASDLGLIGEGKTMLVGIDVTHPSPGSSDNAPSVAGMVASVDALLGQWPAEIRVQREKRNEMVEDLNAMLKAHLHRWQRGHKNQLPENIIVYRDGVSEGQYDTVVEKELPLLKAACKETYPATDTAKQLPRISIVVVGKRHHTRFYPTSDPTADRSGNPSNGTVVDRGVTEARNWDFFLQAHTALKGTARPAHYYTVWDEIFLRQKPSHPNQNTADILEGLTHRLCYLFGRATKAVSICPPAYYADLVCTRARCYLSSAFDPTPSGSIVTGSGGADMLVDDASVRIHANVKDTMFYI
ncbi:Piwi-domain-containing protein [Aspergillus campestris IBT 28561]|uniref:Piwi-domain-containing protein n=1 Tax=Aspergillus campestris (strain IBT 28561) TaxID=1392248 RepID=A0A2I1DAZ7_ASPC2|nr:Piwi-domain-containing protein [Aspergillus campestris IBT 28561]PKY07047.1 Piwi-domain-containing protein [Aspergillus campestris IBT 28561]